MSDKGLKELSKQKVLSVGRINISRFYEECVLGKSSRIKFNIAMHKNKCTLKYIHSEL